MRPPSPRPGKSAERHYKSDNITQSGKVTDLERRGGPYILRMRPAADTSSFPRAGDSVSLHRRTAARLHKGSNRANSIVCNFYKSWSVGRVIRVQAEVGDGFCAVECLQVVLPWEGARQARKGREPGVTERPTCHPASGVHGEWAAKQFSTPIGTSKIASYPESRQGCEVPKDRDFRSIESKGINCEEATEAVLHCIRAFGNLAKIALKVDGENAIRALKGEALRRLDGSGFSIWLVAHEHEPNRL